MTCADWEEVLWQTAWWSLNLDIPRRARRPDAFLGIQRPKSALAPVDIVPGPLRVDLL